ncbi:HDIG domain-containing protein [bacterium]|nr:HDIG domain-containing protein [bacterium]
MFTLEIINAGGNIFEVGGTVRDRLLKRELKDRDYLVTGVPMDTLIAILKPFGKVALVGKFFGVIKFSPHKETGLTYDIAIPRKEISTGVKHKDFQVAFDHTLPVEEDLGRRDFTINAMAWNIESKKLVDPFNGEKDLKDNLLRQVFDNAFLEDPLRLLRAVQFTTRFNLEIEDRTLESMRQHADLIKTVSGERISFELEKLLRAPKPSIGFEIMRKTGIIHHLFPELEAIIGIQQDKQPKDDVWNHTMKVLDAARADKELLGPGDMEVMIATIFHDTGKARTKRFIEDQQRVAFFGHQIVSKRMARKKLEELKINCIGVDPKNILKLIENHMFDTKSYFSERAIRRFINKIGEDLIFKLMDLRLSDNRGGKYPAGIKGVLKLRKRIKEELDKKPPFGPKDLAIGGKDIMGLGIPEGPGIGGIIKQLVEVVLDDPKMNTREQLLDIARNLLQNDPNNATG